MFGALGLLINLSSYCTNQSYAAAAASDLVAGPWLGQIH